MGHLIFSTQFSMWRVSAPSYVLHLYKAQPDCLQVIRRGATLSRFALTICGSISDISVTNKISRCNISSMICVIVKQPLYFWSLLPRLFKRCDHFNTKSRAIEISENLMITWLETMVPGPHGHKTHYKCLHVQIWTSRRAHTTYIKVCN